MSKVFPCLNSQIFNVDKNILYLKCITCKFNIEIPLESLDWETFFKLCSYDDAITSYELDNCFKEKNILLKSNSNSLESYFNIKNFHPLRLQQQNFLLFQKVISFFLLRRHACDYFEKSALTINDFRDYLSLHNTKSCGKLRKDFICTISKVIIPDLTKLKSDFIKENIDLWKDMFFFVKDKIKLFLLEHTKFIYDKKIDLVKGNRNGLDLLCYIIKKDIPNPSDYKISIGNNKLLKDFLSKILLCSSDLEIFDIITEYSNSLHLNLPEFTIKYIISLYEFNNIKFDSTTNSDSLFKSLDCTENTQQNQNKPIEKPKTKKLLTEQSNKSIIDKTITTNNSKKLKDTENKKDSKQLKDTEKEEEKDDEKEDEKEEGSITKNQKPTLIKRDYKFRENVLRRMPVCIITGCNEESQLDVCHIKPIHLAQDEDEKKELNSIKNGITLRKDIHALFDDHLFTVSKDGKVLKTPRIKLQCKDLKDIDSLNVDYYDVTKCTNCFWDHHRLNYENKN